MTYRASHRPASPTPYGILCTFVQATHPEDHGRVTMQRHRNNVQVRVSGAIELLQGDHRSELVREGLEPIVL